MSTKKIYKRWWFWVIIGFILIAAISSNKNTNETTTEPSTSNQSVSENNGEAIKDYVGQDAKMAYEELTASGYSVKFIFDRNNNGSFSEDDFQDFMSDSFASEYYNENPFTVTKQENQDKAATLYVEYNSIISQNKAQEEKEANLEKKLSIINAMTACEQYGKRNYRGFKMHSVLGKIAEYASDEDTWFLKYYVDADGYKNMNMECYVTGTSDNPSVAKFLVY